MKRQKGEGEEHMKKKILALLMATAVMVMPVTNVMAGNVEFGKYELFEFTSTARKDMGKNIAYKAKADDVKKWYVTFTHWSGNGMVSNPGNARMLIMSTRSGSEDSTPQPLYKKRPNKAYRDVPYYDFCDVKKGSKCYLYILGNDANKKDYSIKLAGRYTS